MQWYKRREHGESTDSSWRIRTRKLSRSSQLFSLTAREPRARKPSDTTAVLVWDSKPPVRLLKALTSTRSAHSLVMSQSVGRILTGVVQKMKMQKTIVIRRDYLHYIKKYNRFEKRH